MNWPWIFSSHSLRLRRKNFSKCWFLFYFVPKMLCLSQLQHPMPPSILSLVGGFLWSVCQKNTRVQPGIIAVRAFCHHQCSLLPHPKLLLVLLCAFFGVCELFYIFFGRSRERNEKQSNLEEHFRMCLWFVRSELFSAIFSANGSMSVVSMNFLNENCTVGVLWVGIICFV